jgi:hypothetical protein
MSIHYPLFLLIISSVLVPPLTAFTPTQVASIANTPHGGVKQCPSLFASSSSSSDTDLDKTLREELKVQLLASAEEFKSIQQDLNSALISEKRIEADNVKERGYFFKLIRRIIAKIMGKKRKKPRNILGSDSFGTLKLEVGEQGNKTIAIAEELAQLNPTPNPTYGWMGYGGGSPSDCKLQGKWKLKFTTAADATFPESPKRGNAITSQEVDATAGTLTNVVDFEKGTILGFRVVVAGKATSDCEIELTFKRVVIFRDARIFKKIVFPIPTRLFRWINRISSRGKASKRGPYFEMQYVDDNLRMHKTGEGNWFIQSRLE